MPPAPRARHTPGCDAGRKHLRHAVGARPRVDADLGWRCGSSERDDVAVNTRDIAHLEIRCGDNVIADDEPLCAIAIDGPHQRSIREPLGHAANDVDPIRVGVLAKHRGGAGRSVHLEDAHRSLITALHHDQQAVVRPVNGRHVLEGNAIPLHVDAIAAIHVHDVECHVGVVGTRCGIRDSDRWPVGISGVGDVPALHPCNIDAREEQVRAVAVTTSTRSAGPSPRRRRIQRDRT